MPQDLDQKDTLTKIQDQIQELKNSREKGYIDLDDVWDLVLSTEGFTELFQIIRECDLPIKILPFDTANIKKIPRDALNGVNVEYLTVHSDTVEKGFLNGATVGTLRLIGTMKTLPHDLFSDRNVKNIALENCGMETIEKGSLDCLAKNGTLWLYDEQENLNLDVESIKYLAHLVCDKNITIRSTCNKIKQAIEEQVNAIKEQGRQDLPVIDQIPDCEKNVDACSTQAKQSVKKASVKATPKKAKQSVKKVNVETGATRLSVNKVNVDARSTQAKQSVKKASVKATPKKAKQSVKKVNVDAGTTRLSVKKAHVGTGTTRLSRLSNPKARLSVSIEKGRTKTSVTNPPPWNDSTDTTAIHKSADAQVRLDKSWVQADKAAKGPHTGRMIAMEI